VSDSNFKSVFAVTLFCTNLETSAQFYEKFLGTKTVFETDTSRVFGIGDLLVNLLVEQSVPELIFPETWQKLGQNDVFTLHVEDLNPELQRLQEHGITFLNGPFDRPWGIRAVTVQDPDGHIWEIAQPLK